MEGRVYFVLDLNQCVKEHGSTLFHVQVVGNVLGSVVSIVWVGSIDIESLQGFLLLLSEALFEFNHLIRLENVLDICETCRQMLWHRLSPEHSTRCRTQSRHHAAGPCHISEEMHFQYY